MANLKEWIEENRKRTIERLNRQTYHPEVSEEEKENRYRRQIVSSIREKYSVDDEIAILRQRNTKPEEFEEYNLYCENCKAKARESMK